MQIIKWNMNLFTQISVKTATERFDIWAMFVTAREPCLRPAETSFSFYEKSDDNKILCHLHKAQDCKKKIKCYHGFSYESKANRWFYSQIINEQESIFSNRRLSAKFSSQFPLAGLQMFLSNRFPSHLIVLSIISARLYARWWLLCFRLLFVIKSFLSEFIWKKLSTSFLWANKWTLQRSTFHKQSSLSIKSSKKHHLK